MIGVGQSDATNTGGSHIEGRRCSQAPSSDDEDAGALEFLLARAADLPQDQVAGVALDFLVGEAHSP